MGVVYRAHDEALDRTVALECLHTNLAGDPEIRRRFAREAKVLRSWEHPNVVAVYDFVEQEHMLAIVMEYVAGKSLAEHADVLRAGVPVRRGRVPVREERVSGRERARRGTRGSNPRLHTGDSRTHACGGWCRR